MQENWSGRRVLVTGAGGFIGSHVVERLVRSGARVRGFLRYHSDGSLGALRWCEVLEDVELHSGDLRDPESVAAAVASCDTVLHLGAQISIPYSYLNVRDFFETNVLGTLNVALAACRHKVQRVVLVSSSEVYGSAQFVPMSESHPLQAQSPYAASKIAAEQVVLSLYRSHGSPVTVVRPFNTYGPRQTARAVVPMILSQALVGTRVRLGSLWPRRDFTYVEDTAAGLIALAEAPSAVGEVVNLGTGTDVAIGELVELIAAAVGRELEVDVDAKRVRPEASEVSRLQCDPAKARSLSGWSAQTPLDRGLRNTADWIGSHPQVFEPGRYMR